MYRTYRNLYRIRPAITAIGQGRHRIRLPKGFQITLDMFLLTLALWLPSTLISKLFLSDLVPLPSPLTGVIVAGAISMKLEKLDPSGKSIIGFLTDFLKYIFRKKLTDGFDSQRKMRSFKISGKVPVGLLEDNRVGSLPARGYATDFTLEGNFDVKLSKSGMVTVGYNLNGGTTLPKGEYAVRNNQLFRRKRPTK